MPEPEVLTGWGRTSPSAARAVHLPAEVPDVAQAVRAAGDRGLVARGLGRSYGDAAQNAGGEVLLLDRTSRVEVDPATGVVRVDGGVSLDRLIREILPLGFFLPVSPGTRFVTVGGAIAADIHGKNHHVDGSIGQHVVALTLVDGTGNARLLRPESEPQEFWATVGGMGLTGVVVSAVLRLRPVESAAMRVDTDRADDLAELLALLRSADDCPYSVAWIDLLAGGAARGRGVVTRGEHATLDELPARLRRAPLVFTAASGVRAPTWAPDGLVNHWTMRAFNEAWFRKTPRLGRSRIQSLSAFFHPLDAVADWNRLYGRRGLVQYQFVVPDSAEEALSEAVGCVVDSGSASFLAVLKRLGPGSPGLLSFPRRGWTLALDLPVAPGVAALLDRLDRLVVAAGGRVYLAKDARCRPESLHKMYPGLDEFREVRRRLDPAGVFDSDLARRLAL